MDYSKYCGQRVYISRNMNEQERSKEKIRARATNFTQTEVNLLISLVKNKYQNIIECKKSNAVTNNEKNAAWEKLATDFNSVCRNVHREAKILRAKYENLKKTTKRKSADIKSHMRGTGGGPPSDVVLTPWEIEIQEMLGTQVTGLKSLFDTDAAEVLPTASIESIPNDEESDQELYDKELGYETTKYNDEKSSDSLWNEQIFPSVASAEKSMKVVNPPTATKTTIVASAKRCHEDGNIRKETSKKTFAANMLREATSQELNVKQKMKRSQRGARNNSTKLEEKLSTWAVAKVDLAEMQKKAFWEEHRAKLEHMIKMNEFEQHSKLEEYNMRKEYLKKEQALKLRLLDVQLEKLNK